jgi:hypothetical protein
VSSPKACRISQCAPPKAILGVQIVDPKIILKSFLDGAQSLLGNFEN